MPQFFQQPFLRQAQQAALPEATFEDKREQLAVLGGRVRGEVRSGVAGELGEVAGGADGD